jgi:phage tail tape-measure protein
MIAIALASSISLGACTTAANDRTLQTAATGAAVGAAGGAAVGAVVGGITPIQGAAVGAAIGGVAGLIWADQNQDGYADGYVREGQYYAGTPAGYDPTLGRVATGALVGGAVGAGVGALVPGVSILTGAVVGAVVGGVAGAIWADQNNDGQVDGYVVEGQYHPGAPPAQPAPTYAPPARSGERG